MPWLLLVAGAWTALCGLVVIGWARFMRPIRDFENERARQRGVVLD
jgi:hypothetical protein